MIEPVYQAAAIIMPLIIAIVFHEVAHGWVARMLGDPTAAEMKRLSLNPLRHVDPVGTLLVPGALKLMGMPVFGWAKPVPVNFARLRNPRTGMMIVAAAGPLTNLVLGVLGAVLLGLLVLAGVDTSQPLTPGHFLALNLLNFLTINVFLALFNLLPIPPFDGSHIVEGLLPRSAARAYGSLRQYGFMLVILLIVVLPYLIPGFDPVGKVIDGPFGWVINQYLGLTRAIAGA